MFWKRIPPASEILKAEHIRDQCASDLPLDQDRPRGKPNWSVETGSTKSLAFANVVQQVVRDQQDQRLRATLLNSDLTSPAFDPFKPIATPSIPPAKLPSKTHISTSPRPPIPSRAATSFIPKNTPSTSTPTLSESPAAQYDPIFKEQDPPAISRRHTTFHSTDVTSTWKMQNILPPPIPPPPRPQSRATQEVSSRTFIHELPIGTTIYAEPYDYDEMDGVVQNPQSFEVKPGRRQSTSTSHRIPQHNVELTNHVETRPMRGDSKLYLTGEIPDSHPHWKQIESRMEGAQQYARPTPTQSVGYSAHPNRSEFVATSVHSSETAQRQSVATNCGARQVIGNSTVAYYRNVEDGDGSESSFESSRIANNSQSEGRSRSRSSCSRSQAQSTASSSSMTSQSSSDESESSSSEEESEGNRDALRSRPGKNKRAVRFAGLQNLGNTCYLNSTLQCLAATEPLSKFFLSGEYKDEINLKSSSGTRGQLAHQTAALIRRMRTNSEPSFAPRRFLEVLRAYKCQFKGAAQHDAQEFLGYLLDGLHEDLNLISKKLAPAKMTPEEEQRLEAMPEVLAADSEWKNYRDRNDSVIIDFFHGQLRNRMECIDCGRTSTTFNAFQTLSLPIPPPTRQHPQVSLQNCLTDFLREEILDGDDAWNCPRCRRPKLTSKRLSLARLPQFVVVHLKRFMCLDTISEKVDTPVKYPLEGLELGKFLPPMVRDIKLNLPHEKKTSYRLYGVVNHYRSGEDGLSSGHYTAMVRSSSGTWKMIDDEEVTTVQEKEVRRANKAAYLLFYGV